VTAPAARRYLVRAPLEFRCEPTPEGEPERDYQVRVDVCGLCRSDLYSATSWARDWEELGHEFGGTIVAARRPGGRFQVGQRVAVRNASACRECPPCRSGNLRGCTRLVVNKQGFREVAECDERSIVAAGDLDDDRLALVEPTNVVLDLLEAARLRPAERIAVLGSGTLGLLAAYAAALQFPAARSVVIGRQPQAPVLDALGVSSYVPFAEATRARVARLLEGPPTVVLVTTPPETLAHAVDIAGAGARICMCGLDRDDACQTVLDVRAVIFKRLELEGVFAVPNLFFERAVALLASSGEPLRPLIRRRLRFDDLERGFQEWHARGHFDGKTILVGARGESQPCT
jgi:(R,R)-butanediol dehydrogenase/meso-butanediol dehydrogenase/diacetyl reductase